MEKNIINDKHSRWIDTYLECGNAVKAAIEVGYAESRAKQTAWELKNKYSEEINKRREKIMADMAPLALSRLRQLMEQEESLSVCLGATKDALDRMGMKPVERIETTHVQNLSDDELEREIEALDSISESTVKH